MNKLNAGLLAASLTLITGCENRPHSSPVAKSTCDQVHDAVMALYSPTFGERNQKIAEGRANSEKEKCERIHAEDQEKLLKEVNVAIIMSHSRSMLIPSE
ncbi:MAG: hypothetical protein WC843_02945 [Candidatus Gracilibacteria bacterium]